MVQDHEKTIPVFEKEAREGHNPALKSYAESLTPVLQQHLAEAKKLAGTGGVARGRQPELSGPELPRRRAKFTGAAAAVWGAKSLGTRSRADLRAPI